MDLLVWFGGVMLVKIVVIFRDVVAQIPLSLLLLRCFDIMIDLGGVFEGQGVYLEPHKGFPRLIPIICVNYLTIFLYCLCY